MAGLANEKVGTGARAVFWAAAVPGWERWLWLMGHVIYHLALDNALGALINPTNVK
jgi:hypothetical protein